MKPAAHGSCKQLYTDTASSEGHLLTHDATESTLWHASIHVFIFKIFKDLDVNWGLPTQHYHNKSVMHSIHTAG